MVDMDELKALAKLKKIAKRMKSQDNRITVDPIFLVQQRHRIYGILTSDLTVWLYEGDEVAQDDVELCDFLAERDLDGAEEEKAGLLEEVGYKDTYEFVQPFFSQKAADAYIESNLHNLIEPRVYVDSAYRNNEWQAVREVLLELLEE